MDEAPVSLAGLVCLIERLEAEHEHLPLYHFLDSRLRISKSLNSSDLLNDARALAAAIQVRVPAGEPIVVVRTEGPLTILALFGVILAGCVPLLVPLARRGSLAPIVSLMQKRGLQYVIASRSVASQLYGDLTPSGAGAGQPVVVLHTDLRLDQQHWRAPERAGHDILSLQWRGDADADADLLAVSHRNALNCLALVADEMALQGGHRGLCVQPVDQSDAWLMHVLMPLYLQAPGYFLSIRNILRRPSMWMEAMGHYQCHYSGAPAFLFDVCQAPSDTGSAPDDLAQVQSLYALTARENPGVLNRFMASYAPAGLSPQCLHTVYGFEHSGIWLAGQRAPGSIEHRGRPCISHGPLVSDVKAQLTSDGLPCGLQALHVTGESDRLPFPESAHNGPPLNAGRLQSLAGANWAGVRRTVATGDLVLLRERQLYIHGRSDALIGHDGEYVSAEDIEALIIQTFQPQGIRHCLVIPLPRAGEFAVVAECARREPAARWTPIVAAITELIQQTHHMTPTRVMLLRPHSLAPSTDSSLWRQQCRDAFLSGELLQY